MKILKYWKSLVYGLLILYVSFMPTQSLNKFDVINKNDKIIHFTLYMVFAFILFFDLKLEKLLSKTSLQIFIITIIFSILTELFQRYIFTYRSGSILDFAANVGGVCSAYLIFYSIKFIKQLVY